MNTDARRSVVTGGAGFIGSHLAEYLLDRGDHVVIVDDFSTGRRENLAALAEHPRLEVVEGSILDRDLLRGAMTGADRVFHLAAAVGVHLIIDEPLRSLRTNIHGTENVVDLAHELGLTMLLASTSEVYGKNTADRLDEGADRILGSPLLSRWTYAAAKGIDEAYAHAYWSSLGLPVTIVRLFNTVGPRQTGRYGMVLPRLAGQALRGEPMTVYGDGRQTRCFSYVGDIVPALVALVENPASHGLAVNLGGAEEISILELAERIAEVTGSESPIQLVPYADAYASGYEDMRRRVPDNSLAGSLIGFFPHTRVDEIIRRVAEQLAGTTMASR
ncbi:nucleoside-diphosphate sugar epimerase [Aeromicrobium sp. PE09-221]|uniref:NAD-dependent epimerase/dehydratase family protein n=1 Tax=Aeromicrobium sp. PE09-221 TaxID=1898043 RepID=UPI000B3EDFBD|nr:NAD-dependent epimerase/dehydratase family protein [Aeromicrobium sp. PE09-221]OUZ12684.1 nucleoside-diphosphate sugar epimerase [Aeromicrobium sp. PE09-221]